MSSEDGVSQSRDHHVVSENGTNTVQGKTKRENLSDIVQVLGQNWTQCQNDALASQ